MSVQSSVKHSGIAVAVATVAGATIAFTFGEAPRPPVGPRSHQSEATADRLSHARVVETRRDETRRDETRRDETARQLGAVAVAVRGLPGEDELTLRWRALSPEARQQALHAEYREAVRHLKDGESIRRSRSRAESALSGLRAELYGTPKGRRQHERLERQLESLVASLPEEQG